MRTGAAISFSQRRSWWHCNGTLNTPYDRLPPLDYVLHAVAHAGAVLSIWGWW